MADGKPSTSGAPPQTRSLPRWRQDWFRDQRMGCWGERLPSQSRPPDRRSVRSPAWTYPPSGYW